jgi:hypothetical protein
MWKFRLRLHHDLSVIRDTNQKIVGRINEIRPASEPDATPTAAPDLTPADAPAES